MNRGPGIILTPIVLLCVLGAHQIVKRSQWSKPGKVATWLVNKGLNKVLGLHSGTCALGVGHLLGQLPETPTPLMFLIALASWYMIYRFEKSVVSAYVEPMKLNLDLD